jgi:hypothetical protein
MNFTDKGRSLGRQAMEASENFTSAQRIRRKFMVRRPRKHDQILTPTQAVYRACLLADEVQTAMLERGLEPKGNFFCALVVQHEAENVLWVKTALIQPDPAEIKKTVDELNALKNPKPLGVACQVFDHEVTPSISRNWARPFLAGDDIAEILLNALKHQSNPTQGVN